MPCPGAFRAEGKKGEWRLMMHPMWPDGGFYVDPGERKLGPAQLGDALTQAVQRRDTAAARDVFDHAFWHKTDFHPDWLHLYLAVSNKDREMVKLLTAYGATWTEDQAKIACANLADRLDNLHGPLHAAGIRTDYTARDLETVDVLTVFEMNSRLLD